MDEIDVKEFSIEKIAMDMIMHAGDAKNLIVEALDLISQNKDDEAAQKLSEANNELIEAHHIQTSFIQHVASGEVKQEYSVLFTHAQDTMMTVYSEFNITNKLLKIFKNRK